MLMRFIVFVLLLNLCALTSYAQDTATSEVSSGIQVDQLTLEEIDYLIQKLSSCWLAPAGAIIEKGMMVKIAANYDEQGRVEEESVRLLETNIDSSNEFYSILVESAIRTFSHPECKTLDLPKEKYELWKQVNVTFDHSIMEGYE